ncbi:unnamed protein product [Leuciscus chuanchicus]
MHVDRAIYGQGRFRSFTYQEMWQWYSLHKRLQADPQAGSDHERKMAQEAYCSIRQWLVMKEDDITTKTLKRFRQYILDREKPQQDTARPAATDTSSKQRFPVRKTPRQDVVPPAATATSNSSRSKGDDSWMDDALLVEALATFERQGDAGGKQRGLEEGQPGTQKLRTIAPAAVRPECPASGNKSAFLYRCGYSHTVRQICGMSGWHSMLTEVLACNAWSRRSMPLAVSCHGRQGNTMSKVWRQVLESHCDEYLQSKDLYTTLLSQYNEPGKITRNLSISFQLPPPRAELPSPKLLRKAFLIAEAENRGLQHSNNVHVWKSTKVYRWLGSAAVKGQKGRQHQVYVSPLVHRLNQRCQELFVSVEESSDSFSAPDHYAHTRETLCVDEDEEDDEASANQPNESPEEDYVVAAELDPCVEDVCGPNHLPLGTNTRESLCNTNDHNIQQFDSLYSAHWGNALFSRTNGDPAESSIVQKLKFSKRYSAAHLMNSRKNHLMYCLIKQLWLHSNYGAKTRGLPQKQEVTRLYQQRVTVDDPELSKLGIPILKINTKSVAEFIRRQEALLAYNVTDQGLSILRRQYRSFLMNGPTPASLKCSMRSLCLWQEPGD